MSPESTSQGLFHCISDLSTLRKFVLKQPRSRVASAPQAAHGSVNFRLEPVRELLQSSLFADYQDP